VLDTLADCLERWNTTRDPDLATLIRQFPASTVSLPIKRGAAWDKAWEDLAEKLDPADLPVLLAGAIDRSSDRSLKRLKCLKKRPPDPRLWEWMLSALEKPPMQALSTIPFWEELLKLLPKHAFPAEFPRLEKLNSGNIARLGVSTMGAWFDKHLQVAWTGISTFSRKEALSKDELELIKSRIVIKKPVDSSRQTTEALFSEIYASPDDNALRAVLADALMEAGNPRGEFIALQLQEDAASQKKARALLKLYEKEWLGPFDRILSRQSLVWKRGFIEEAALSSTMKAIHERDVLELPEWSTIKVLTTVYESQIPLQPALKNLVELRQLGLSAAAQLAGLRHRYAIRRLSITTAYTAEREKLWLDFSETLKKSQSLPELQQLEIGIYWLTPAQISGLSWFQGTLIISSDLNHIEQWQLLMKNPKAPLKITMQQNGLKIVLEGSKATITIPSLSWWSTHSLDRAIPLLNPEIIDIVQVVLEKNHERYADQLGLLQKRFPGRVIGPEAPKTT
jgi:uncharacterized protein (TIGR02996 family)